MRWRLFRLNWSYGLGELVIVITGVLIALAVNEWNSKRLARIEEAEVIERLISDLNEDVRALEDQLSSVETKEASLLRIRSALAVPYARPDDPAGFLRDVIDGANYGWNQYEDRRTTFDELLGSGKFSLIRAADLRDRIAEYYDENRGADQRIDARETKFPHLSYRLVPRENEGTVESDRGRPDVESNLTNEEIERLVTRVLESEIGDYVDAEINLARFIRNLSLRQKQNTADLIDQLEEYLESIS